MKIKEYRVCVYWLPKVGKINSITESLHQKNDPVTFCFHPGLWNLLRAQQQSISDSHMLPIWEPLHGQRQIPPIAWTSLAPSSLHPSFPHCTPVWVCLPPLPATAAAAATTAAPKGNLHFNRQSRKMRVCVQASSRKRTQLHKFPMNPPDNSWASENDILGLPVCSLWNHIHKNIHTCIFSKTRKTSEMRFHMLPAYIGVIRYDCEAVSDLQLSLFLSLFFSYWDCVQRQNEQSSGGSRKKACLRAGVITEHDGSITAVIRHQTKGTSRAGQRGRGGGGEDGPRHSRSITRPLDEVSAPERGEGGQYKCSHKAAIDY